MDITDAFHKTLDKVQNDSQLWDQVGPNVIDSLKGIFDPEISINIYDLGLIYDLKIESNGKLWVLMTFTSVWCPFADELLKQVKTLSLEAHEQITEIEVVTTMVPQWGKERVAEEYRILMPF